MPRLNHAPLPPGVFEDHVAPDGERWFRVVTRSGRVGMVHLPAELVNPAFIEDIARRIESGGTPAYGLKLLA